MPLKIELISWKVGVTSDSQKQKVIGGEYAVKSGATIVAKSDFNIGYNATSIPIPADLMAKVEAIDAEIKKAIEENFAV